MAAAQTATESAAMEILSELYRGNIHPTVAVTKFRNIGFTKTASILELQWNRYSFTSFWEGMFTVKIERGTSRDGFSLNKNHRSVKHARGKKQKS